MNLTLHVWRQNGPADEGRFVTYRVEGVSAHMSFLEMLDHLNEQLIKKGEDPVAFDSDCREGICGMCGFMVNGDPHGPLPATTVCQLHMRVYKDGDELWLEPWRAAGFPVIKDLVVNRSAFDRIIAAGGYVSVRTGSAPEANSTRVPKINADAAMDAAECIACGACVAACPNASAMLFTAAKVAHLAVLPQGQPERYLRVAEMVAQQDADFGHCTNHGACENACPKAISTDYIALLNGDLRRAKLRRPTDLD
ncbi:MAG TPA: succinate dehydrogenase/fumarate reductase iron-sulfur subunit [Gemmatimonadales bacterium]|nr:succinate dehydrogenase/fumarate reductase iron-sulfur subunit [Gemmatimonadales bacterium]